MLLGLQLNELGQTMIAGAPLLEWLKAIGVWAALSVVFIVVQRVLASRIEALAARTRTNIDNVIANVLRQTRAYFLVGLAFLCGGGHRAVAPAGRPVGRAHRLRAAAAVAAHPLGKR